MTAEIDVTVVGGGAAGLTTGLFTARYGSETVVIDAGRSILRRNAHHENFPAFPAGVNPRQFLDSMREQAEAAGCEQHGGTVTTVSVEDDGFRVETDGGQRFHTDYVVTATKNTVDYLEDLDDVEVVDRGKTYVETDERGRTDVDGVYAAGRLAGKPHQAIICAGHGAEVALTLLEDDNRSFYHDWIAPEGYFTDRGRDVPPGCEKIDEGERSRRERQSMETARELFAELHLDGQVTHPSLTED